MNPALLGGRDRIKLSAAWVDISAVSPAALTNGTGDPTLTWSGPSRLISVPTVAWGTMRYRINVGAWTDYTAPFSLSSGQTLGFMVNNVTTNGVNSAKAVVDAAVGVVIGSFNAGASGYP